VAGSKHGGLSASSVPRASSGPVQSPQKLYSAFCGAAELLEKPSVALLTIWL